MPGFVISDDLAKALAGYRWRFSRKRLDRTFDHQPRWWQPVSAQVVKGIVSSRLMSLLLGEGHRGYHRSKTQVAVVAGVAFTEELAKLLRSNLYLNANKEGNRLLVCLANELRAWLESNKGAVILQTKHPRQRLALAADNLSIVIFLGT